MSVLDVTRRYALRNTHDNRETNLLKRVKPCAFWTAGRCGIHKVKPDSCSNFEPRDGCDKLENWIGEKARFVG